MNRRRRRRTIKQPIAVLSMWMFSLSIVSIALFSACLWLAYNAAGKAGKVVVGMGVLGMLIAIAATVVGYKEFKASEYFSFSRVLGVLFPLIASMLWIFMYIFGLFVL